MDLHNIRLIAGSISSLIFVLANINMLWKAWRTKDLHSYSLGQITLNNIGNVLYWLYVCGLPLGPIYLMHGFFTLTSLLMLIWYISYHAKDWLRKIPTMQIPRVLNRCECP